MANFGGAEIFFLFIFYIFYMVLHLVLIYSGLFQKKAILGALTKMQICIVPYALLQTMQLFLVTSNLNHSLMACMETKNIFNSLH